VTDTDADWRKRLRWEFRAAKRLFVLGVGNPDRADDGAGSRCARQLERLLARSPRPAGQAGRTRLEALQVLDGGEVPESATGVIRRFQPTHVLIIDAAAAGRAPGSIFFLSKRKIPEEDLTTHRLPLSRLVRYIEESLGCRVILLGIEPGDTSSRKPMSPAVRRSCEILADAIEEEWLRRPDRPARRRPRPEVS
jgi:hydrogenase 3 maturation protease